MNNLTQKETELLKIIKTFPNSVAHLSKADATYKSLVKKGLIQTYQKRVDKSIVAKAMYFLYKDINAGVFINQYNNSNNSVFGVRIKKDFYSRIIDLHDILVISNTKKDKNLIRCKYIVSDNKYKIVFVTEAELYNLINNKIKLTMHDLVTKVDNREKTIFNTSKYYYEIIKNEVFNSSIKENDNWRVIDHFVRFIKINKESETLQQDLFNELSVLVTYVGSEETKNIFEDVQRHLKYFNILLVEEIKELDSAFNSIINTSTDNLLNE